MLVPNRKTACEDWATDTQIRRSETVPECRGDESSKWLGSVTGFELKTVDRKPIISGGLAAASKTFGRWVWGAGSQR